MTDVKNQCLIQQAALASLEGKLEDQRDRVHPSSRLRWDVDVKSSDFALLTDLLMDDIVAQSGKRKPAPMAMRALGTSMRVLCANLLINYLHGENIKLQVTRNRSVFTRLPVGYEAFTRVLNYLLNSGYVVLTFKGVKFPDGYSLESRIQPTEKLIDNFARLDTTLDDIIIEEPALILVRDTGGDGTESYASDQVGVPAMVKSKLKALQAVNHALKSCKVSLDVHPNALRFISSQTTRIGFGEHEHVPHFVDLTEVAYHRIFNSNDLNSGGRFYGPWWQNIPSKYRTHITINGHPTVELDFKAIHPALAYARLGIALTSDPYCIDLTQLGLPKSDSHEYKDICRPMVKHVVNAYLNSPSGRFDPPSNFEAVATANKFTWESFKAAVLAHHTPLEAVVGIGTQLQRVDSDIAESIMLHFAERGEVCLSVHDSFIVPVHLEHELEEVMVSSYEKCAGVKPLGISCK